MADKIYYVDFGSKEIQKVVEPTKDTKITEEEAKKINSSKKEFNKRMLETSNSMLNIGEVVLEQGDNIRVYVNDFRQAVINTEKNFIINEQGELEEFKFCFSEDDEEDEYQPTMELKIEYELEKNTFEKLLQKGVLKKEEDLFSFGKTKKAEYDGVSYTVLEDTVIENLWSVKVSSKPCARLFYELDKIGYYDWDFDLD